MNSTRLVILDDTNPLLQWDGQWVSDVGTLDTNTLGVEGAPFNHTVN